MSRPTLEVADLVRSAGTAFIERNRRWIRWTTGDCTGSRAWSRLDTGASVTVHLLHFLIFTNF